MASQQATQAHREVEAIVMRIQKEAFRAKAAMLAGTATNPPPLLLAAAIGRVDLVDALLAQGASVHARDTTHGMSALHAAARLPLPLCASRLATAGCPVNACDARGLTPAHYAALSGRADTLEVLLRAGANPNASSRSRSTPLHAACAKGQTGCARVLLAHGANPAPRDALLRDPASYAERNGFVMLAAELASACGAAVSGTVTATTAMPRRKFRVLPRPASPLGMSSIATGAVSGHGAVSSFAGIAGSASTLATTSPASVAMPSPTLGPSPVTGAATSTFTPGSGLVGCSMMSLRLGATASECTAASTTSAVASISSQGAANSHRKRWADESEATDSASSPVAAHGKRVAHIAAPTATPSFSSASTAPLGLCIMTATPGCVRTEDEDVGMEWF